MKPHQYGVTAPEALTVIAVFIIIAAAAFIRINKDNKVCIAEKTITEILSVGRHETVVKYNDGTIQRVSTPNGVTLGDKRCFAYQ